eukprot:scaffold1384_cov116-Cylindrotheca_fusiformis.AAC.21
MVSLLILSKECHLDHSSSFSGYNKGVVIDEKLHSVWSWCDRFHIRAKFCATVWKKGWRRWSVGTAPVEDTYVSTFKSKRYSVSFVSFFVVLRVIIITSCRVFCILESVLNLEIMPIPSRKRPLLLATNKNQKKAKPALRTETTLRIERMLDEETGKSSRKKKKNTRKKLQAQERPNPATTSATASSSSSSLSLQWSQITKSGTRQLEGRRNGGGLFSSLGTGRGGGLSSAPSYRKASIPSRRISPAPIRKATNNASSIRNLIGTTTTAKNDNVGLASSATSSVPPKENNNIEMTNKAPASATTAGFSVSRIRNPTTSMGLKLQPSHTTNRTFREKFGGQASLPPDIVDLTQNDVVLADPKPIVPPSIPTAPAPAPSNKSTSIAPQSKKKPAKTTATILASTEATNKLLLEAQQPNKIVHLSKPAAKESSSLPPPAYQRHSDVVAEYLQRREDGKKKAIGFQTTKVTETNDKSNNKKVNDNFVRLNMRNTSGSCRGAKNKKSKRSSLYAERYSKWKKPNNNDDGDATRGGGNFYTSKRTGLDPLDDYADGIFHKTARSSNAPTKIPKCARHQLPCKLIVVKKTSTGNKGRKFYACSMPRGEQCLLTEVSLSSFLRSQQNHSNHFEWADDTIEAAREALAQNQSSHSGFITRQVASYVDRFRNLTVPELRDEATKRKLPKTGKKKELLVRLAIWVRDEIAKSVHERNVDNVVVPVDDDDDDSTSSGSCSDSVSSCEELELVPKEVASKLQARGEEERQDENCSDDDGSLELDKDDGNDAMTCDKEGPQSANSLEDTLCTLFGHAEFRDGQEWAIRRCLSQQKSLLVAPTGFGKSLCYALPAAMLDGITVVVSPLVSLIQDQLRALPPRVPAATLSGSISVAKTAAIVDDIIHKRIKILFVSPERLASPSFQRLFRVKWNPNTNLRERSFPEVSLLCIDEAHCVSQWAHNFRPCFLRFKSILSLMSPKSILAITATAGPRVIDDICQTISIPTNKSSSDYLESDSIKLIQKGRDNIDVSCQFVESQEERLRMLSKFLSPRPKKCKEEKGSLLYGSLAKGSVIVYVWRQKDTEVVAEHLNAAADVNGGVVLYHGGMDAGARSKSQSMFMRGKARICVATVAFGMGIDKADVVGVVHLYLSSSPEHYLQEIGRAGRDGRPANAIALPMIEEIPRRHSLEHSSILSKSQIKALLYAVRGLVPRDKGNTATFGNMPFTLALPVEDSVLACDCKIESIETLLSLIEQNGGDDPLLHVVGFNYDRAIIALKKRPLKKLASKEPVAASINAVSECFNPPVGDGEEGRDPGESRESNYKVPESFQRQFLAYSLGSYSFSVVDCASHLGPSAEPRHVFAALRRLQSSNELELSLDTTDKGRVFHLKLSARGASFFRSEDFDSLAEDLTNILYERFVSSIISGANKVLDMSHIMDEVATARETTEILHSGKSTSLVRFQELVDNYFNGTLSKDSPEVKKLLPDSFSCISEKDLRSDTLSVARDLPVLAKQAADSTYAVKFGDGEYCDYSALAVTKFLHGIDSPRAPFLSFRTHPLFGKWNETEFLLVLKIVTEFMKPVLQSQ